MGISLFDMHDKGLQFNGSVDKQLEIWYNIDIEESAGVMTPMNRACEIKLFYYA